jgi:homoserine O-acetyltransferase/O-succinyltransferase
MIGQKRMRTMFLTTFSSSLAAAAALLFATAACAADVQQTPGDWTVTDFRFHTGEVLPELKLHYVTIGEPTGAPVLVLHGSNGSGQSMLGPSFAGELFGPGQPLDAAKYFIIVPDALGAGRSSKPSNGLRTAFPQFNYEDQVRAQYRLLTEHLGVKHLKLIIGQSMGGMHAWMWGEMYPDAMDVLVPMASQPAAMSGRNWVLRRMVIDAIKADPAWNNGNYTQQPPTFKYVANFFSFATAGGTQSFFRRAPTREAADKLVDQRLADKFNADANDYIYAYGAARDYDPSPGLETIKARVLAINSADDERNPAELGVVAREIKRVKNGTYYEIPASPETVGHGTPGNAKWWKHLLPELLSESKPEQ